jgi:hypothetical protein
VPQLQEPVSVALDWTSATSVAINADEAVGATMVGSGGVKSSAGVGGRPVGFGLMRLAGFWLQSP